MSKTYRKSEFAKSDPLYAGIKKKYNRRLRKQAKRDVDSIPNGNAYKKMNESYDICDYKFSCSWEDFKNWGWAQRTFKSEDDMRRFWKSHYKYR